MRRRERVRCLRELHLSAPPAMVAAATERRLAGDWRGACAAALVDVDIDLRAVASAYGARHAGRIEAELAGFAPDLLRRSLPRAEGRLVPRAAVVLSGSDEACREARRGSWQGPVLVATLPRNWRVVRQSITLRVLHALPAHFYDLPDWAWHADAVANRRWVYGAGPERLPWHFADRTPYPEGTVTPPEQAADRTGEVERIAALLAARQTAEAFAAAGFSVEPSTTHHCGPSLPTLLARMGRALPVARAELFRLTHRYGPQSFSALSGLIEVSGRTVRRKGYSRTDSGPWMFALPAPAEAALLRSGDLGPDELHPLVHEALFPGRSQQWRAPLPHAPERIRVRCGTQWHVVVATGGQVRTPHHDDAEIQREFVRAGPGGPVSGCAAAVRGWRTGKRPLAKDLRKDRQALFALALHGDTDGLLIRLADGLDPDLRGPGGGTLLHWLAHLDHRRVLPVLLGAGLSLGERDHEGRTALHAAAESAAEATMAALVAAGADPGARDRYGRTPAEVLAEVRDGP